MTTIIRPKPKKRGDAFGGGRLPIFGPMATANGHLSRAQDAIGSILGELREADPKRYALCDEAFSLIERARRNLNTAAR